MNEPALWGTPPPIPPVRPVPKTCNHLFHLILGLCTCGLWWIVWLFFAAQVWWDNKRDEEWYVEALHRYNYEHWVWQNQNGR